jgi:hypothetical protein
MARATEDAVRGIEEITLLLSERLIKLKGEGAVSLN